jgi:hypothetical protein
MVRMMAKMEAGAKAHARLPADVDYCPSVGQGGRQRLFAQHVPAGFRADKRVITM